MVQRECPVCRQSFEPTTHNQRFCPPTDEERTRATGKTQPRSRCAKRAENAKRYGWDPSSRPLVAPFDCIQCGEHCVPGENVAPHATRFCGKTCKASWHRKHRPAEASKYDPERARAAAEVKRHHSGNVSVCWTPTAAAIGKGEWRVVVRHDPCAYCGARPSNGIDHIDPNVADRNDESNWTASCKRCNELKRTVPLLPALLWIPVTGRYHEMRRLLFG